MDAMELIARNRRRVNFVWTRGLMSTEDSSRAILAMWDKAQHHVSMAEVSRQRGDVREWAKLAVYAARKGGAGVMSLVQFEDALWKALAVAGVDPESIGLQRVAPKRPTP